MIISIVAAAALWAGAPEVSQAQRLYNRTDYRRALDVLQLLPEKTAADWLLIGKSHFMMADFKKATEALEKGIVAAPGDAEIHLWLGRAYGRRAETSSIFTAPSLALKSRQYFEKSVELNPKNKEALNDLFEYYLQAPGFMGGGEDKARALIARIRALDPAEAYFAEARLAENRKEWNTAEMQLRRAADAGPRQVGRVVDLARFLARQGKIQESEAAFRQAEKINPDAPQLLFARAQSYVEGKRNLEIARTLLERYLKSPLSPDDPPRTEAERLLRQARGE